MGMMTIPSTLSDGNRCLILEENVGLPVYSNPKIAKLEKAQGSITMPLIETRTNNVSKSLPSLSNRKKEQTQRQVSHTMSSIIAKHA